MRQRLGGALLCAAVLCTLAVNAAPPDPVPPAIERGVAALKRIQINPDNRKHDRTGTVALIGLTLLECDVPANDPAIEKLPPAFLSATTASP